jgi:hypothetical protein
MSDSVGGKGVVTAVLPRHRSQGHCSCGWVGRPRLLLSLAKCDALIHAAQCGCEPAIPLIRPEPIPALRPLGTLDVECPAGCGATFSVPLEVTDSLDNGVVVAPRLHSLILKHLMDCSLTDPVRTRRTDPAHNNRIRSRHRT